MYSEPTEVTRSVSSAPSRHVVFAFDDVTWDSAQRRRMSFSQDQILLGLMGDPAVERLLVCNRPRSAPIVLVKDRIRRPAPFQETERMRLRQPLRLRRNDPTGVAALKRHYRAYDRRLRRAAHEFGLERPAIVTSQAFIAGFCDLDWAGPVTYLAIDDFSAHPSYRRWQRGLLAAFEELARRRRRLCAVSNAIVDRVQPRGASLVLPNAVDPELWSDRPAVPDWLSSLPGPRLLYLGTLDTRLDVEATRQVARAWPQGSVVLVGPLEDRAHLAGLLGEPNVFHHGAVGHGSVPAIVAGADACLIPHHRTDLTVAMSPLKLYEYLAAGRPVAVTDLEPMSGVAGPVFRVAPAGDFRPAVAAALAAGPTDESERRRFIEENAWPSRRAQALEFVLASDRV
ncbi:MAG TPA: glycosyltransferase [Solirubrobacterales bacterium]|jgi:glycosyltransferase involved in cell wall biosynthesis|nr:glycosyltransferase [Solirubrobacterales bacterium]